MAPTTRHGEQPVVRFLKSRGISYKEAAAYCGVTPRHLRAACVGVVLPAPQVKERLPRMLGLPIECLFTEKVRLLDYNPMIGGKNSQLRNGIKPNDNLVFSDAAVDAAAAYLQATEVK